MTPRIEPGQRWRRKSDGVEVQVMRVNAYEVQWIRHDRYRGGDCLRTNFTARYDLIAEAPR